MEGSITCSIGRYPAKLLKKISRARAKFSNDGFECSDTPTPYLVISNGGLSNGVRRKDLEEVVTNFKTLKMYPQKSYAFATFESSEVAAKAMNELQGHVLSSEGNLASASPVLYLHFVKVPLDVANLMWSRSMDYRDVPGLILREDFVSSEEEVHLVEFLTAENHAAIDSTENALKHRQVWHYGYKFRYMYNDVDPSMPLQCGIPGIIKMLITRMRDAKLLDKNPDQITVNKYEPGQGIPPHIDNPEAFEETLASLSLHSQTVMDFKDVKSHAHVQVLLKPRSLAIFTGDSRYSWTHGICPRKVDLLPIDRKGESLTPVNRGMRYSITFRRVREDYKGPDSKCT